MKNKQEQIEEMAKERNEIKDIMKLLDKCVSLNPMCKAEVATVVYDNNYRKITEDSVVLSREEYEKLKLELAQKIYDDIFAILKIKLWLYGDDVMTKNLNGLTKQKILDFTKKWGIEDNHLNEKDYSHIDHLQVHDKQIKEQARKETTREILLRLYERIQNHYGNRCSLSSRDVIDIAERYGVELFGNSDKLEDEE